MFKLCVALILIVEILSLALLPLVAPDMLVVLLAPLVPLTVVLALVLHTRLDGVSYGMWRKVWRLTPERITGYRPQGQDQATSPITLSRSIVERATEIRRAMLNSPSEVQVEICALGYRACVNDMITLTYLANEELPNAGFLRRMRLRRARRRATDALSSARTALPPGALRTTHQERQ